MLTTVSITGCVPAPSSPAFAWDELPAVPDNTGFAGSFAGVSNNALLVAGGANFPDGGAPWTGSAKMWYDKIFVLETPQGPWKEAGKLPRPLGYGVSLSWRGGLVCLGGSNADGHFADAFILRYDQGRIQVEALPAMPKPNANACGVLLGDVVYVAGGLEKPDATTTESLFWALNLARPAAERKWEVLPSWPGPSRMLPVAGAQAGAFYLFSGTRLKEGKREYLRDAYKYVPGAGWSAIADVPQAMVAAPSPTYAAGSSLFLFGGDDGKYAETAASLKENHPGFSRNIWQYDTATNAWTQAGEIFTRIGKEAASDPNGSVWAPVTTPLVTWNGQVVLPGGEVRPATRTPRVLTARPQ